MGNLWSEYLFTLQVKSLLSYIFTFRTAVEVFTLWVPIIQSPILFMGSSGFLSLLHKNLWVLRNPHKLCLFLSIFKNENLKDFNQITGSQLGSQNCGCRFLEMLQKTVSKSFFLKIRGCISVLLKICGCSCIHCTYSNQAPFCQMLREQLHSVSSYKKRVKFQTSVFHIFLQNFDSFCFLFF